MRARISTAPAGVMSAGTSAGTPGGVMSLRLITWNSLSLWSGAARQGIGGPHRFSLDSVLRPLGDLLAGRLDPERGAVRADERIGGVRTANGRGKVGHGDLHAESLGPVPQEPLALGVVRRGLD